MSTTARQARTLESRNAVGKLHVEEYDYEDFGECGVCFESVYRVVNSSFTRNADRTRYRYPTDKEGWCIFRCRGCGEVISDNWRALTTRGQGE
jgi:ABC-type ATPase with predicted acetyltransferase domain